MIEKERGERERRGILPRQVIGSGIGSICVDLGKFCVVGCMRGMFGDVWGRPNEQGAREGRRSAHDSGHESCLLMVTKSEVYRIILCKFATQKKLNKSSEGQTLIEYIVTRQGRECDEKMFM